MFRRLHLQMTALCIAITGLILTVLSCLCLFISESDIRRQEYDTFFTNLTSVYQNLEQQIPVSHNWIRQTEQNSHFFLRITDNGSPLFFQALPDDHIPESAWEAAEARAWEKYRLNLRTPGSLGNLTRHGEFTLTHKNASYNASVALIPRTRSDGFLGVTVLQPQEQTNARIVRQRIIFLLADLAALALLGAFYWFFTARMIRPLQENKKKQMQFVASASHELRSPLTVILSNTAAVKNGVMPGDVQFLDVIESEGNRMSRLISDMLQLAGADSHTWSIRPAPVELDTLLLQTWENFETVASAHGLRWEISLPETSVQPCVCDAERIRQLLCILIDNAFSYTPSGGRVQLALSQENPKYFQITVSDNGPGIPDEEKAAVFERFRRLDKARRDKSHFGLGLCIAQEIAHLHRGRIILSDTPGGGATFTVLLLRKTTVPSPQKTRSAPPGTEAC